MSAKATRRPDNGNWCVRWKFKGLEGRIACEDEDEALSLEREIERAHKQGHNQPVTRLRGLRPAAPPPSLVDVVDDYVSAQLRRGRARGTVEHLRTTLAQFLGFIRETVRPQGQIVPALLSERLLEDYVDWQRRRISRHGAPLGERSLYRYLRTVEAFWEWAAKRERWESWVPRARSIELEAPIVEEVVALTWAQIDNAIHVCPSIHAPGWVADLITVGRFTGLRHGQIWRIEWTDLQLGGDVPDLKIRAQLGKSRRERQEARTIPIAPAFADWLRARRRADGYIVAPEIAARDGLKHSKPVGRVWRKSGVPEALYARRPVHALRRAFETEMTRRGATGLAIDFLLGHSPRGTGPGTYLDKTWGLYEQAVEAVSLIPPIGEAHDLGRQRRRSRS